MDAHIQNDSKHIIEYGMTLGQSTPGLVHVVLSGPYLETHNLIPEHIEMVYVQTRFHGCGLCTPWKRVQFKYVQERFLDHLLIPASRNVFSIDYNPKDNMGGLFISLPLYFGQNDTFDEFNTVVIKIKTTTELEYLYLTYGEFYAPQAEFQNDDLRIWALFQQLKHYLLPYRHKKDKLTEEIFSVKLTKNTSRFIKSETYTNPLPKITTNKPPVEIKDDKVSQELPNILLSRFKSKQLPKNKDGKIQSGLTINSNYGILKKKIEKNIISVLEDPSFIRNSDNKTSCNVVKPVTEILYARENPNAVKDEKTTIIDLICRFVSNYHRIPINNKTWLFSPISIQKRTDYNKGLRIFIIKYSASNLDTEFIKHAIINGMGPILQMAYLSKITNPSNFSMPLKKQAIIDAPVMACAFNEERGNLLSVFKVNWERDSLYNFKKVLLDIFGRAIKYSLTTKSLRQLFLYNLPKDMDYEGLASIIPSLTDNLLQTEFSSTIDAFLKSAIFTATVAYRSSLSDRFQCPYSKNEYLFDYYMIGQNLQKENRYPQIVKFESSNLVTTGLSATEISKSHATRVKPGESQFLVCLGLNSSLETVIVFPGGFSSKIKFKEALDQQYQPNWDLFLLPRFANSKESRWPICPSITP